MKTLKIFMEIETEAEEQDILRYVRTSIKLLNLKITKLKVEEKK